MSVFFILRHSLEGENEGRRILELEIAMHIFIVYRRPKNIKGFVKYFREVFIMNKLISTLGIFLLNLFIFTSLCFAQHSHGGMSMGTPMKMDTKEVLVEGVKVVFQMMANEEHKKMLKDMKMKEDIEPGTSHNITVILKDEKTQKEITNAQINMKVIDPKGKDQIKALKYEDMMKSYDAYFNLPAKGRYQVMILAKTGEKKITAGIYYEVK